MNKIENNNLTKLVIDARDGVDGAFEKLYEETIKFSYGVACVLLKNEEDIEDVLQNSYMYVAKYICDLKDPEKFESWLATIVRHECQKYIVKNKKITDIFANMLFLKELEIVSNEKTAYEFIEKRDVNESIRKIVESLPDDKRACIILYYFEQNTVSEIAEILGIPEGTVKSRLYNGRKILEKEFKKLKKKDETLYGVSVIPLVVAFFAYQAKNIVVPASIADGAAACIAATTNATATTTVSVASTVSGVQTAGATATGTTVTSAVGSAAVGVTTKVVAIAVTAAVATGGTVATVSYVNNKKDYSTTVSLMQIIEEHTTADLSNITEIVVDETALIFVLESESKTVKDNPEYSTKKNISEATTQHNITSKTTQRYTTVPMTAEKKTTKKETTKRETTFIESTTIKNVTTTVDSVEDIVDVYSISSGILAEYTGSGGSVSIPSEINGDTVVAIGTGAFAGNSDISSVSIPSTVSKIGQEAFSECDRLETVGLPSSLKSIGIGAFYGCSSLQSVDIPAGVTSIGDDAFADCLYLETVTIPSSVTTIGDNAFGGCKYITIRCYEGSAAHDYAVENSVGYELI